VVTSVAYRVNAADAGTPLARIVVTVLAVAIVVEVTNLDGVLTPGSSALPRAVLAVMVLTAAAGFRDTTLRARLNRVTVIAAALTICYAVGQGLAALGSQDSDSSLAVFRNTLSNCVFLIAVLVLVQMSGRPWAAAAAFVTPLAVLCALCLVNQIVFAGTMPFGGFATVTEAVAIETPRYGGPLTDSNFWGRHLVMAIPLAGALSGRAVRVGDRRATLGWSAAVLALLAGVYLTQSRGTILATAAAVGVWVAASGPLARRREMQSLPVVAIALLAPGIGNRLLAILADVSGHSPHHVVDPSIVGRMAAQQIAWAMFADRPLFGLGPGTFKPVGIPQYAGSVRTAVFQYTTGPDAPHNLYAQLAGETGLVGLVSWLVFVGGFVVLLTLQIHKISVHRPAATAEPSSRSLAAAVLAALLGWSAASVFLHLAHFRTFAIMLALAAALATAALPLRDTPPLPLRALRNFTVAVLAGIGAAGAVLAISAETSHSASQRFTLLPTAQMTSNYPYSFGIRTREVLLPTYAVILTAGTPGVSAIADTVRGLVTIEARAADAETAGDRLAEALAQARRRIAESHSGSAYSMVDIGGVQVSTVRHRSARWNAAAAIIGLIGAAVVVRQLRRSGPRSRR
jgi:O-antigen ligase